MLLILSLLFGAIGSGYIIYGKREHDAFWLLTGFGLAIYPYFFSNLWLVLVIGILLSLLPVARAKEWI